MVTILVKLLEKYRSIIDPKNFLRLSLEKGCILSCTYKIGTLKNVLWMVKRMRLQYHEQRDKALFTERDACIMAGIPTLIYPRLVHDFNVKRILDVGCANGSVVNDCIKYGMDAYGIDIRDTHFAGNNRLIASDAFQMPFQHGSFDLVLDSFFVEDLIELQKLSGSEIGNFFQEVHRVLREGGFYMHWGSRGYPIREFSNITGLFSAESILEPAYLYRKIKNGPREI